MPTFSSIPQLTRGPTWKVDVSWSFLPAWYHQQVVDSHLDVNPEFQRGHVWTPEQKARFVEFCLRGGTSGINLYCNCEGWGRGLTTGTYVLVDGKQRLDAVLGFLNNEFPIFDGHYRKDYQGSLSIITRFTWHVNDLSTYPEVLQWYLELNAGGTPHSEAEIDRVRALLAQKAPYVAPTPEQLALQANLSREVIRRAVPEAP